jgi:hypothetical protein
MAEREEFWFAAGFSRNLGDQRDRRRSTGMRAFCLSF